MPIATPEVYADMLDRAKNGSFAYPAINITSSQTRARKRNPIAVFAVSSSRASV